ncbi:MAG: four helix bundle protein [Tepidisphaeraceae bacterium]
MAEEFADAVWNVVVEWDFFARDTLGKQLARAADSVGANIAEGGGEQSDRDQRRYLRYARRSLRETRFFLRRAHARTLVPPDKVERLRDLLDRLGRLLTAFTRSVERRSEPSPTTRRLADSPIEDLP